MTRRKSRESAFCIVFGISISHLDVDETLAIVGETGEPETDEFAYKLIKSVYTHIDDIDNSFKPFLKGWSIERLSKASLAILRISCAQLFYWDEIANNTEVKDEKSENIIINEAVELAKKYGNDDDYMFVNGVLGSIVRKTYT